MARPIMDKDAERFEERTDNVGSASAKEIEEARKAYETFKAISIFPHGF